MAERRKRRRREVQLGFEAISIEGGLLSPEWLSRIAQLNGGVQGESDYRIPKGLNVRDEIGRYWRIAQACWNEFAAGRAANAAGDVLATRFIESLLRDAFGFSSVTKTASVIIAERSYPIGMSALDGRVPIVVASATCGLDTPATMFGDGGRRRSAFGLAQEYLNSQDGSLWGIASDGVMLRVVRDNASLTRPAWIEADLQRVFTEERYADFAALWLLMHETRFGRADQPVTECALEAWRNAGREEGTRAREHLRRGVEDALLALGQGFLSHPDNQSLRADLRSGSLSTKDYFNQLLRLIYRIIFLLTVEERGLLHSSDATEAAKTLYQNGYSLRRLRDRSVKRSAHDRFSDLWESTKIVLKGVASGEQRLGLPALAGIFAINQCSALDLAKLENRALLFSVFKLAWLRENGSLARVNWRDMGPEELGSVYESLLELVPQITNEGRRFAFASSAESKGNARKTTGSYYTPDSLVQLLLDSALEPVISETVSKNPEKPIEALLGLSIVDPACGSGHFLLAAARRLASHVARLQANGTPSASDYRHALRQVVGRCIYGVDLNPMAIELCKVSLWMEAVEPGLPLTFLNSHIQHGNALFGTTPELMAQGVLDIAWEPIQGDDKKIASLLKKRNKAEAGGQRTLTFAQNPESDENHEIGTAVSQLEAAPDADVAALTAKESTWKRILGSEAYCHQKFVADLWCTAFVWPKQVGNLADAAPTNELWRQVRDGAIQVPATTIETANLLCEQNKFFHWHLQFPHIFSTGGFDVVLGNPPWDAVSFKEVEFFASRVPEIAEAATAALRKRRIAALETEDKNLYEEYRRALRQVDALSSFARSQTRYPLTGTGVVNLFSLFAELARTIVSARGRIGQVLPSGIVTDNSTKLFFQSVIERHQLVSFFDFENREGLFPTIDSRIHFGVFTLAGSRELGSVAEFAFFATRVEQIKDPNRRFNLSVDDIALLNPATKTCPIFRTRRDAVLASSIYRRLPIVTASGWDLEMRRLLHSADDSGNFLTNSSEGSLRLYEGKSFHHYDHRWVTNDDQGDRMLTEAERENPSCLIRPRNWYPANEVVSRFGRSWKHAWAFAWRDITNSTNERTFIATVVPSIAILDTAKVIFVKDNQLHALPSLIANLGAFVFDFVARQKVGGTHMSAFIMEQLPILEQDAYSHHMLWLGETIGNWLRPRVLELTYTAWDLEQFAREIGCDSSPFRWDTGRRFLMRCELDAAFFHLYGLSRDDADYVMDTFPIVRRNDEKAHTEYRTKRIILEIYDAMAEASRTGKPYQTRLDPLPADIRMAHPSRAGRFTVRAIPSVVPSLPSDQEAAILVFAFVYANGGIIRRMDLARAFALRSQPDVLARLAPAEIGKQTAEWVNKVGQRNVAPGLLAGALRVLSDRAAVELGIDDTAHSTVKVCLNTPAENQIDPWFQYEARLALQVLKSQAENAMQTIDASVSGTDRALLDKAS